MKKNQPNGFSINDFHLILIGLVAILMVVIPFLPVKNPARNIVIWPGHEILLDGKTVKLFGREKCPISIMEMLYGPYWRNPVNNCIVIDKDGQTVLVSVFGDGVLKEEILDIKHEEKFVLFSRSKGSSIESN